MKFKIEKQYLYVIISLIFVLGILVFIEAVAPSVMGHTANEIGGMGTSTTKVPDDFCIFSDTKTTCPTGFSQRTSFAGRSIRIDKANLAATGGSDMHNHATNNNYGKAATSKGFFKSLESASSWPPYVNVLICCKD